jgi:hypothetical protein
MTKGNNRAGGGVETTHRFWEHRHFTNDALILIAAVRFAVNQNVSWQYVSALMQETIAFLKLSYAGLLAHEMSSLKWFCMMRSMAKWG